jgi:hypothetical protein
MRKRKSPSEYEQFIATLVRNLKLVQAIDGIGAGSSNRLPGHSGVKHQIDVSFVDRAEFEPKLVVVECKNLNDKGSVKLRDAKVLKATVDDLREYPDHPRCVHAILISAGRAQRGALRFAKHYGIDVQTVGQGPNWSFRYGKNVQFGAELHPQPKLHGKGHLGVICRDCGHRFSLAHSGTACPHCGHPHHAV